MSTARRAARPGWEYPVLRSLRRSVLVAAAIALLVAGAALGVRLGLDLLRIEFAQPPSASPTDVPSPGADLGLRRELGTAVTFDEARAAADFPLLVPDALGPPDEVYLGRAPLRDQIAFLYDSRPGLPASALLDAAGLLVTQTHGSTDPRLAGKLVNAEGAVVEPVSIGGADGYWFAGPPHVFWYLAPNGSDIVESRRQVGNTLVWERDGILYRIEGAISKDRALEIATSMR
jgi:hypothetical protein